MIGRKAFGQGECAGVSVAVKDSSGPAESVALSAAVRRHKGPGFSERPTPFVSVVIPFSRPDKVGQAIASVLAQDYPADRLEIIVVGWGSEELRERWPGIRTLDRGPMREPGRARNLGAEIARGQFLLFLDDDCEAQGGWIQANLAELQSTRVGAVGGMVAGKATGWAARTVDFANFGLCQTLGRQERPICSASFGIRRSLFHQVGGFDESMPVHEDIDLCHRLEIAGHPTVYQSDVRVLHDHGRNSLRSLLAYMHFGGRVGGLAVEERYSGRAHRYRILLRFRHPLLYLLLVPVFAAGGTLQTIKVNLREHREVILLSPAILLAKISCHLGIWRSLLARRLRGSWVAHGGAESIRAPIKYILTKRTCQRPRHLTLFVTSQCNARCGHCFYWTNLNHSDDLSFDEIAGLSGSLGQVDKLLISGGEPFLRKDLPEICRLFYRNNELRKLSIPTNGLQPELIFRQAERVLQIADGRMVNISLSLDGLADVHDQLRGVPGGFDRALETHKGLHELQGKYGNLSLRSNSVVTEQTYDGVVALLDELPSLLPGVNLPALTLLRGDPCSAGLSLPSIPKLRLLHRRKSKSYPGIAPWAWRLADWLNFTLSLEALRRKTQVVPCEAGRLLGVVEEDGDVKPCEMLPAIGNIRQGSFGEIWTSAQAQEARSRIAEKSCFCTHECNLFPSFLANPVAGWLALGRAVLSGGRGG